MTLNYTKNRWELDNGHTFYRLPLGHIYKSDIINFMNNKINMQIQEYTITGGGVDRKPPPPRLKNLDFSHFELSGYKNEFVIPPPKTISVITIGEDTSIL